MANTYSQLYNHIIFAVKDRTPLIPKEHRDELHKYITGIIRNNDCKLIAINSMPDHIHIFLSMHPKVALSDLVRDIKTNSSVFIKEKGWSRKFSWQEGFGAFSYSRSQRDDVIRYVQNQEEHHSKKAFREEYIDFLKAFDIEYDERYIFEDVG
jgi:putative transposase